MLVKSNKNFFFKITSINASQRQETIERERRPLDLELTFSNPRNQWKKMLKKFARYCYRHYKSFCWRRRYERWELSRVRSVTNILWFCVHAWMYLKLKNKYKTFINVRLIFTKSCIPILLLILLFCLLSVKVEAFKHMWGNTANFFVFFFKKNFSLSLKKDSFQWHEILEKKFGQLNKWYRPYRLYWISWKVNFLFYEKKSQLEIFVDLNWIS